MDTGLCVYLGDGLRAYHFGPSHPFGPKRHDAFADGLEARGLIPRLQIRAPEQAEQEVIEYFHTHAYVERVKAQSATGHGYLDLGDTPAFRGVYEAAAMVVGSSLAAVRAVLSGHCRRAFVPIAGLHHAHRDGAAGFCVFNDCGVAIEFLRRSAKLRRIAYVDIDAHHGDGVFYAFEDDPDLCIVDVHEDGRYLYPGTGAATETGKGSAAGSKHNFPLPPGASDAEFMDAWAEAETFVDQARPEFILLQCGADGLAGDPITHLAYTENVHAHVARRLRALADRHCEGRLVALGGGGYALDNLARAWCSVVEAFLE